MTDLYIEKATKKNFNHVTCSVRRPSGVPEKDFCSFLMPYYQKQEAYMKLELKKIQAENAALAKKVQAGRDKISQTENRISTAVDEWKVREKPLKINREMFSYAGRSFKQGPLYSRGAQ